MGFNASVIDTEVLGFMMSIRTFRSGPLLDMACMLYPELRLEICSRVRFCFLGR